MKHLHIEYFGDLCLQRVDQAKKLYGEGGAEGLASLIDTFQHAMLDAKLEGKSPREPILFFHSSLWVLVQSEMADTYNYSKIANSKVLGAYADMMNQFSMMNIGQPVIAKIAILETYHAACFKNAGSKIFEVSPGLAEMLRQTEIHGLTVNEIRTPYEAQIILVPPSLGFKVWDNKTGWHPLSQVYIVFDEDLDYDAGLRLLLVGDSKNAMAADNAMFYFDLPFSDLTVEKALADRDWCTTDDPVGLAKMEGVYQEIFRWAINVLLYVVSEGSESETEYADPDTRKLTRRLSKAKGSKRERIKRQLRPLNKRKHIVLGRSITLGKAASAGHAVRTRVRGHWHGFWSGSGLRSMTKEERETKRKELFKIKWVKPHWRGHGDESNPIIYVRE